MTFKKILWWLPIMVLGTTKMLAHPGTTIIVNKARNSAYYLVEHSRQAKILQMVMAEVTVAGEISESDSLLPAVLIVPNIPPIAHAGDDIILTAEGSQVITLNGEASTDEDGKIVSYLWTIAGKKIAEGKKPIISLGKGKVTITLTVTDDKGAASTDEVQVTINEPNNIAPTANAGNDQTYVVASKQDSAMVSLSGIASTDEDGTINDYDWYIGDNSIATGETANIKLGVGNYTVLLKVTDNKGLTSSDEVLITVQAPVNQQPIADAGNDYTIVDKNNDGFEEVMLDGSNSKDIDGSISTYSWHWGLSAAQGQKPTVKLSRGKHEIILTVTDNEGSQASDTVLITVIDAPVANQAPVANAGEDQTLTDEDGDGKVEITLNGSASADPDGTIASYTWYDSLNQQRANGASAKITLDTGRWTVYLKVTDDKGASATDSTMITINSTAPKPLGIFHHTFASDTRVYPNPSTGLFVVAFSGYTQCNWSVSDTRGQVLISQYAAGNEIVLDISAYASGVYHLVIRTNHGQQIYRLAVL